jgi:hypothetical protein
MVVWKKIKLLFFYKIKFLFQPKIEMLRKMVVS